MEGKQLKLSRVQFLNRVAITGQVSLDCIGPQRNGMGGPGQEDTPYLAHFIPEILCVRVTREKGKLNPPLDILVPVVNVNWMEVAKVPPPKKVD